jgi:hypothetical protein
MDTTLRVHQFIPNLATLLIDAVSVPHWEHFILYPILESIPVLFVLKKRLLLLV